MKLQLDAEDHQQRGSALRNTFPAIPHGRHVLFGALMDAAIHGIEEPQSQSVAEHDRPE